MAHILETALLVLAAYLTGCVLGYGIRRIVHAGPLRRVTPTVAPPALAAVPLDPPRPRSPAIRLAASVDPLPVPDVPAVKPVAVSAVRKPRAKRKAVDPKPAALAGPHGDVADNLKQIKGIGPKIEASLNGMGIFHFSQIAGWTDANIDWVDSRLAFKGRIRRERWVEQAQERARGETNAAPSGRASEK